MAPFTMHNIHLSQIREVAPGLWFAYDQNGMARLFEPGKFRGYVLEEFGRWRVDCWGPGHTVPFRRRYKTKAGAERGLIFHGARMNRASLA